MSATALSAAFVARIPSHKLAITRAVYESAGLTRTRAEAELLVQRNLIFTAGYYRRALLLREAHYRRRLQRTITPLGADAIADALTARRGVILTSVHLGDFDLAASWIAEVLGSRPVVPVATCPSRAWQSFYDAVRSECGFALRRQEATRLEELEQELECGRLIILMLDRRPSRAGLATRWFGRAAIVSAAASTLAGRTGAPLVSAATWGDGNGGRKLVFGPPRAVESPGDAPRVTRALVAELETSVRAAREQWHVPGYPRQLPWEVDKEISATSHHERPR